MVVFILTNKEQNFGPVVAKTAAKPFFMANKRLVLDRLQANYFFFASSFTEVQRKHILPFRIADHKIRFARSWVSLHRKI